MEERNSKQDIDHDQGDPIRENIPKCTASSDNDSTDSSSSSSNEDEISRLSVSSETGTKEKQHFPFNESSKDSSHVSLEPFVHQVGGHIPMVCLDADTVCKPLIEREHKFYRSLPESLKPFTPQFEGLMHIEIQANPDGCIALTGNPPSSRKNPGDKETKSKRETKRMKSRQKLHLLLQHLHNGEKGKRSHKFEWIDSKSKIREGSKNSLNRVQEYNNTEEEARMEIDKEDRNVMKPKNALPMDPYPINGNDSSSDYNHEIELFYNPWALKCHQDHFKKLGLRPSDTVAFSSKLETAEGIEPFPKTRCTYLLLENVVSNQVRPCILDLKVGARQYPDDCSSTKKKSKMAKSAQTTSSTLGLRLCGMQIFNRAEEKYICLNKYDGRTLTDKTFVDCIRQFLNKYENVDDTSYRGDVRRQLIAKLLDLKEELKLLNTFRFYTSSLLVTYDGYSDSEVPEPHVKSIGKSCDNIVASHDDDHEEKGDNVGSLSAKGDISLYNNIGRKGDFSMHGNESQSMKPLVDVRLIDFAHATHIGMNDKATYEGPDDNFISGISNFISILKEL